MQNLNPTPAPTNNSNGYGKKPITVTDLNRRIKATLERDYQRLWIVGEVGNLTIHRSGHVYCTLKDDRSQVRCVFFNGAASAREIKLVDGTQVEIADEQVAVGRWWWLSQRHRLLGVRVRRVWRRR